MWLLCRASVINCVSSAVLVIIEFHWLQAEVTLDKQKQQRSPERKRSRLRRNASERLIYCD